MKCERIENWDGNYSKKKAAGLLFGITVMYLIRLVFLIAIGIWIPAGAILGSFSDPYFYTVFSVLIVCGLGSAYGLRKCQQKYMRECGMREV